MLFSIKAAFNIVLNIPNIMPVLTI